MSWYDAVNYCTNKGENWRLPSVDELYFIALKNRSFSDNSDPSIDEAFNNVNKEIYWTSTSNSDNNDLAWAVKFNIAFDFSDRNKTNGSYYVRCVKGKELKTKLIRVDDKNIVFDKQHKLQWQDNLAIKTLEAKTEDEAQSYCENLELDGTNWRLPNVHELYSITDKTKHDPAIKNAFRYIHDANSSEDALQYWTSTKSQYKTEDQKERAYVIKFNMGDDGVPRIEDRHYVRCVRDIE